MKDCGQKTKKSNEERDFLALQSHKSSLAQDLYKRKCRAGFSLDEVEQFGYWSENLAREGFNTRQGYNQGWVFRGSNGVKLCRLQPYYYNEKSKEVEKYLQTKGASWLLEMVANPKNDVVYVVEGVFKALMLYCCGFNAIAYSGTNNCFKNKELALDFANLVQKYSEIIIGYDIDSKLDKRQYVEHNVFKLANQIKKLDKVVRIVDVWDPDLGKDFDEIAANHGRDKLKEIVSSTSTPEHWNCISVQHNYSADLRENGDGFLNSEKITKLIQKHKHLAIKAPMGSGKTHALAEVLAALNKDVLVIVPTRVLGKQVAKKLGIPYRDDINGKWESVVCCLESVTAKGKLKIKDGTLLKNKVVIIDEGAEIGNKMLFSSTLRNRVEYIGLLADCLRNAAHTVYLSADFNDQHLALFETLLVDKIFKYEYHSKRNNYRFSVLSKPAETIALAETLITLGKKVLIAIDSQQVSSTYSTGAIARRFDCESIVVDSDTVKQLGTGAFRLINDQDYTVLEKIQALIISPSAQSGFSLDTGGWTPDAVFTVNLGSASPDGTVQVASRVRDNLIPRYFCFGGIPTLMAGGALSRSSVKRYVHTRIKNLVDQSNQRLDKDSEKDITLDAANDFQFGLNVSDQVEHEIAAHLYTAIASENLRRLHRKEYALSKIRINGGIFVENISNVSGAETVVQELKEIKKARITEAAIAQSEAKKIDQDTVSTYKEAVGITLEQKHSLDRYYADRKLVHDEGTTQDYKDNIEGKLEPETLGFWFKAEARKYLEFVEQEALARKRGTPIYSPTKLLEQRDQESSKVIFNDLIKNTVIEKVKALEECGIVEALDFAKTNLIEFYLQGTNKQKTEPVAINNFVENVSKQAGKIGNLFGINLQGSNPQSIFRSLLKCIGYEQTGKKRVRVKIDDETHQVTVYQKIKANRLDELKQKRFDAWLANIVERHNAFVKTQNMVNVGRYLIDKDYEHLIRNYKLDDILEAARLLPRKEFGLSRFFEIHRKFINKFQIPPSPKVVVVNRSNVNEAVTKIKQWRSNKTIVGFDAETYGSIVHDQYNCISEDKGFKYYNKWLDQRQKYEPGLDQNSNLIRLIQLSDGETTFVVDLEKQISPAIPIYLGGFWQEFTELTKHNELVGHNLKFDTSSIRKYDIQIKQPYDTLLASKLLLGDCGASKVLANGYGLKSVMHSFLSVEVDKTEQKSDWGASQLSESQVVYAANDAHPPLLLKQLFDQMYQNPAAWGLGIFANEQGVHANLQHLGLENRSIYALTEMQWRGIPLNIEATQQTLNKLEKLIKDVENDWYALRMPCKPSQAIRVCEELNQRYDPNKVHPLHPEEIAKAIGVEFVHEDDLPKLEEKLTGVAKDVINDHPNMPEMQVLNAWRTFKTAKNQISKILLSAEIHGRVKTEFGVLSGTGRVSCGNQKGLGCPNLQGLLKKAEGKFYGFIPGVHSENIYWEKPALKEIINIRELFHLAPNSDLAFITEDANASHNRLAVAFGRCEFGKKVLDEGLDSHSMFAIKALKVLLKLDSTCLDDFPEIRDFINDIVGEITKEIAAQFRNLDTGRCKERFRNAAKTLFYSVLNGAQAEKMRKVMAGAVGRLVDIAAGEQIFAAFWGLYKGIKSFIDKVRANAEANEINLNGIAYNVSTLPDGMKLAFPKKEGDINIRAIVAAQWSRSEATIIKRLMQSIDKMPTEWGAQLINSVHDEIGFTCSKNYWIEAYRYISDAFAQEFGKYLNGFVACDEPTEVKLAAKKSVPNSWSDK